MNSYSVWINSNFLRDFSFSSTHFARKVGSDFLIFQKPNIPLAYAKSVSSSYVQSRIIVELKLFNYKLSYNYLRMRKNSLCSVIVVKLFCYYKINYHLLNSSDWQFNFERYFSFMHSHQYQTSSRRKVCHKHVLLKG